MTDSAEKISRPRLSVAMIVRDEQEVLATSIDSVRPIADEIVVLDTGSTDQTVTIAKRLGAVVGQAAWDDDFSAARNRCLEQVTGDWVLWLDAGELAEIRKLYSSPSERAAHLDAMVEERFGEKLDSMPSAHAKRGRESTRRIFGFLMAGRA